MDLYHTYLADREYHQRADELARVTELRRRAAARESVPQPPPRTTVTARRGAWDRFAAQWLRFAGMAH